MWVLVEWIEEDQSISVLKDKDIIRYGKEITTLIGQVVDVAISSKEGTQIFKAKVISVHSTKGEATKEELSLLVPEQDVTGKRKRKPSQKVQEQNESSSNGKGDVEEESFSELLVGDTTDIPIRQIKKKTKKNKSRELQDSDNEKKEQSQTKKKNQNKKSVPESCGLQHSESDGENKPETQKKKPKKISVPPLQVKVQKERVDFVLSQRREVSANSENDDDISVIREIDNTKDATRTPSATELTSTELLQSGGSRWQSSNFAPFHSPLTQINQTPPNKFAYTPPYAPHSLTPLAPPTKPNHNNSMMALLNGNMEDKESGYFHMGQFNQSDSTFQSIMMEEMEKLKSEVFQLKAEVKQLKKALKTDKGKEKENSQEESDKSKIDDVVAGLEPRKALNAILHHLFTTKEIKTQTIKGVKTWKCGNETEVQALDPQKLTTIYDIMRKKFKVSEDQTKTWIRNTKRGLKY